VWRSFPSSAWERKSGSSASWFRSGASGRGFPSGAWEPGITGPARGPPHEARIIRHGGFAANCRARREMRMESVNCSPDPQELRPNGDLIGADAAEKTGDLANVGGVFRNGGQTPGEEMPPNRERHRGRSLQRGGCRSCRICRRGRQHCNRWGGWADERKSVSPACAPPRKRDPTTASQWCPSRLCCLP